MEAHVEGCYVRSDPKNITPFLRTGYETAEKLREELLQEAEEIQRKAAKKARRKFNSVCKKFGVPIFKLPPEKSSVSSGWNHVVGEAEIEVPEAAKLSDLTVFAGPLGDYHHLIPNVLEHTLLESGHPILFSPDGPIAFPPKMVTIAWDASVQATRAVFAAHPFLERAEQIDILSVEEPHEEPPDPQKLSEYLAWHGLNCKNHVIKKNHKDVAHVLLEVTKKSGANFLIMGGYAHSRFKEVVFGGTTLYALRNAHLPIFMMH